MTETTYQFESLREIVKEPALAELIREHWEASGVHHDIMPLAIDWSSLLGFSDSGVVRVVTARRRDEFTGYMGWWIYPHPVFVGTKRAIQGPWNLHSILGPSLRLLREIDVRYVVVHTKNHITGSRSSLNEDLLRKGFQPVDTIWTKTL